MSQIYANRRRAEAAPAATSEHTAQGPSLAALQAGAMPTAEQMGHRVDLPEAIRAKMEASFGADLSGVQLYESQTVADAGAIAMAMGNKIGFAPGKLDFASSGGQALLGHELSHVVSQARGEVTGGGFLNDHALEARADREGAMAAAGESVYSGPVTPISVGSSAMAAAGPMQAKKPWQKEKADSDQEAAAAAPVQEAAAAAPVQEAPALDPAMQEQAQAALAVERGEIDAGRAAFDATKQRYEAAGNTYTLDAGADSHYYRYLQRHLRGKSDEAQDAIFSAFATKDKAAMAPYLASDIRNFNSTDFSNLNSESDSDVISAYGQHAVHSQDMMSPSDFVKNGIFSAEDLGMSQRELDLFNSKKLQMGTSLGEARMLTKNYAGTGGSFNSSNETLRQDRSARRADPRNELLTANPVLGTKTSEQTMGYRGIDVEALRQSGRYDPATATEDEDLAIMYDMIKKHEGSDDMTPEALSNLKREFARKRARQIDRGM